MKVTLKQFTGYKQARRDGISHNDNYNVATFGITMDVYIVIRKLLETLSGNGDPSGATLAEINRLLAGERVRLAYADTPLLKSAQKVLS